MATLLDYVLLFVAISGFTFTSLEIIPYHGMHIATQVSLFVYAIVNIIDRSLIGSKYDY